LASIVEKETAKTDEMATVAGVYLNRLRVGMKLEADPTVIYAIGNPEIRRVTYAMLEYDSPYNTYKVLGLPPGPICLPSIQAIEAVLKNEQHNYIYFCAKEDFSGYHNFTHSYNQHLVNSRKYQLALSRKGIR
ncbi:MAG: endolytic transglycosylase MltG, partial [Bacteroidota bacterium]|nr:endolytic transglycosylase MltG [Bacteroidota bacterium]MDX5430646.1 endolytic transglycosylase MltG [Bacteroidota bacterium]MDX5469396.1 endolytic transglycosylase MltG [Bacteroidota bacterium]